MDQLPRWTTDLDVSTSSGVRRITPVWANHGSASDLGGVPAGHARRAAPLTSSSTRRRSSQQVRRGNPDRQGRRAPAVSERPGPAAPPGTVGAHELRALGESRDRGGLRAARARLPRRGAPWTGLGGGPRARRHGHRVPRGARPAAERPLRPRGASGQDQRPFFTRSDRLQQGSGASRGGMVDA